jgi:hypothetical protein
MRFSIFLSVAFLLSCLFAQAREKKDPNPNLANIHKVFIKGNSEAATVARNRNILPLGPGGWEEIPASVRRFTCFGLVRNEGSSDATLEISQDTAPDGMVTVSGTITDHAGNLLWSDSKHDLRPPSPSIPLPPGGVERVVNFLMSGLKDEICGIPQLIELSKVRKIYVLDLGGFKNVTWKSGCLTFVESSTDADAEFKPALPTRVTSTGQLVWVLFDDKSNSEIPGWETNPQSFGGVADLEKAVGCR